MKNLLLLFLVLGGSKVMAQQYYQLYYNTDLNNQVAVNHAARLVSEKQYQKTYQKQIDQMDRVKESVVKVVVMKDQIYRQLKNVNGALKQGKYVQIIYNDFTRLLENMGDMVELTAENPEYAILITRFYEKVFERAYIAYSGIADQVQREENDYLMDNADRQNLMSKLHTDIRVMNGWVLHINSYLRRAKKKPYLRHFKVLNSWYIKDKQMIKSIITNSGYLTN